MVYAVSLKSNVDKAMATTSDVITFTVALTRPPELSQLAIPEIGEKFPGFRIIEFGEDPPEEEGGLVVLKKWYKLQADISGSYVLPSLKLNYTDSQGQNHLVETSEIFVEIESLTPTPTGEDVSENEETEETEKDIRDIKDLASIGPHPLWNLGAIVGAAGVLIGFLIVLLKFRKKKERVIPEIPPHEWALKALERLQHAPLDHSSDYKKYFFELSEITRTYFENSFGLPATDRTTEELELMLEDGQAHQIFIRLLKDADKVKFTDYLPTQPQAHEQWAKAIDFVKSTSPQAMPSQEQEEEGSVI